jgi:hypothetical protein
VRGEIDHNVAIDPSDLPRLLEEHGLPATIFGYDAPPAIDVEPKLIEAAKAGNGANGEDH